MRKRTSNQGVTLVELLVVMSVITIMAAMLGLAVPRIGQMMQETKAKSEVQKLASVVELYRKDCGVYPDAINHNAGRTGDPNDPSAAWAVPVAEVDGYYPCSKNPTKSRSLYQTYIDETDGKEHIYTELVWTLGSTVKGWPNPQLFDFFQKSKQLNASGQLVDAFRRRLFYLSSAAYLSNARTKSGALTSKGSKTFMNPGTYQIYSVGINMKTYLDSENKGGMDEDDINNWSSMID